MDALEVVFLDVVGRGFGTGKGNQGWQRIFVARSLEDDMVDMRAEMQTFQDSTVAYVSVLFSLVCLNAPGASSTPF